MSNVLDYATLPTVNDAFARMTPVAIAEGVKNDHFTFTGNLGEEDARDNNTLAVVTDANLMMARADKENMHVSQVTCLGSTNFGLTLKATRKGQRVTVNTVISSVDKLPAVASALNYVESNQALNDLASCRGLETVEGAYTSFVHKFDVSNGIPRIISTLVDKVHNNETGDSIPKPNNINGFLNLLEYLYTTSDGIKNAPSQEEYLRGFGGFDFGGFAKTALVTASTIGGAYYGGSQGAQFGQAASSKLLSFF